MIIPWIYILQAWLYIYNYMYRYIYVRAYTCILGRFIVLYLYSFGSSSRLVNGVVHCNFLSIFYTYIHVIEDRTVFSYYNSESLLLYPSGVTLCMWCAYIYIYGCWSKYNCLGRVQSPINRESIATPKVTIAEGFCSFQCHVYRK